MVGWRRYYTGRLFLEGAFTGDPDFATAGGGRSAVLFLVMVSYAYGFLLQAFARAQNRGCALQAVVVNVFRAELSLFIW